MGNATWTCGYDEWIGSSPDFSDCTTLDLGDYNNQLNDTESIPSEIIDDVVNNELGEADPELSSGDILGLVELMGNALDVSEVV